MNGIRENVSRRLVNKKSFQKESRIYFTGKSYILYRKVLYTLQDSLIYFTEKSYILYRKVLYTLQESLIYFTEKSYILYRKVFYTLQKSLIYFTGKSYILYRKVFYTLQEFLFKCYVYKYLWKSLCVSGRHRVNRLFIHYVGALVTRLRAEGGPGDWAGAHSVRQSTVHITATFMFLSESASSISSTILSIYEGSGSLPKAKVSSSMTVRGLIFWLLDIYIYICTVQSYRM